MIRRGLSRFSGSEVDTSGDGFFATFERPNDALSCACFISDEVRPIGIDIRIGLHADGVERHDLEFLFIAVASRVSSLATGGEILITGGMKTLLTDPMIPLQPRGAHVLRGLPGEWDIFAVDRDESGRPAKAPISDMGLVVDPRDLSHRSILTLMFTDMLGATALAAKVGNDAWREISLAHDALIRGEVARYGGNVVDTAGDHYFATFEWPLGVISCAYAIQDGVRELGVPVRIGLHSGEIEDMGDKVGGIAVPIGARVGALASAGEILVSSTVKDLVEGSGLHFVERGQHDLKGLPGVRSVFALETRLAPSSNEQG